MSHSELSEACRSGAKCFDIKGRRADNGQV
jgi:hypothetical protein